MKKNIIFFAFMVFLLVGCAHPVKHKLYGEYSETSPRTIAVLPIGGNIDSYRVKRVFRRSTIERLESAGFEVMDPDEVDDVFFKRLKNSPGDITTRELAALLPTDAIIYVYVTDWDEDKVFGYASLRFGARFKILSRNGELLWKGRHSTKESDMGFDKKILKLGVFEAYEARVERLVDNVLSTLPAVYVSKDASGEDEDEEQKEFFRWLP